MEEENDRLRSEVTRLKAGVVYMASSGPGGVSASPRGSRGPTPRPSSPRIPHGTAVPRMEQERMVREAELRQLHNQQRAQLKAFLQLSAGNSKTIGTEELKLAAKLAKMSLPDDVISKSPRSSKIVSSTAEDGSPREVQWQEYVKALEPVHPRTAADAAKRAAKRRNDAARRSAAVAAASAAGAISLQNSKGPVITEKELKASHDKIRNHFATRFTEVRRGFRLLDEDHSGRLDREELKAVLMMFNLDIKSHLVDKIIDIADADGSGDIDYAEFAQIMTCENIFDLNHGANAKNFADLKGAPAKRVGGPTIRAGVNPKEVQYAQQCLKESLLTKYSRLTDAFKSIDDDRTGHLEREEVKRLLVEFNIPDIKDAAIETLIDFADYDGDGEINYAEFARVLTADDVMKMKETLAGNVS
jgi:Ca2+-binding EF-hand superfamily protein